MTLLVGAFYWVQPTLDPDRAMEWEYYTQPARFYGYSENGDALWQCIGMEDPSNWPMCWVGPRIEAPSDEAERIAVQNEPPAT